MRDIRRLEQDLDRSRFNEIIAPSTFNIIPVSSFRSSYSQFDRVPLLVLLFLFYSLCSLKRLLTVPGVFIAKSRAFVVTSEVDLSKNFAQHDVCNAPRKAQSLRGDLGWKVRDNEYQVRSYTHAMAIDTPSSSILFQSFRTSQICLALVDLSLLCSFQQRLEPSTMAGRAGASKASTLKFLFQLNIIQ